MPSLMSGKLPYKSKLFGKWTLAKLFLFFDVIMCIMFIVATYYCLDNLFNLHYGTKYSWKDNLLCFTFNVTYPYIMLHLLHKAILQKSIDFVKLEEDTERLEKELHMKIQQMDGNAKAKFKEWFQ